MPFKSQAQRKLFYAKAARGEISKSTVKHWEDATPKNRKLPEHVKKAVDALANQLKLPLSPIATLTPIVAPPAISTPTLKKLKEKALYKMSTQSGENIANQLKQHSRPDSDFRSEQLQRGIEVEKEHSDEIPIRKAIAKGHLSEFKDYYIPNLEDMEKKLKKEGAIFALMQLGLS